MARHPKPENANNPLRRLRQALAKDGVAMGQDELSKRIGVPVDTIKSVEAGRLSKGMPSRAIQKAIFVHLGVRWHPEEKEWSFLFSQEDPSREDVERYRAAEPDRDTEIHALCLRLICLLQKVPKKNFGVIADTIDDFLVNKAEEQKVDTSSVGAGLELHPVWRNEKESPFMSDIIGYRRKREQWVKKGSAKRKLFDFRDRLRPPS
jgi:DNA-binding XRE family transcriptional regulator